MKFIYYPKYNYSKRKLKISYRNNNNTFNKPESEGISIKNFKINNNALSTNKQLLNNNNINLSYKDFEESRQVKNYNRIIRPGKNASLKIIQDSSVIKTKINNIKDFNILSVLNDHGQDGYFVSEFISELIPPQIIKHPEIKILKYN